MTNRPALRVVLLLSLTVALPVWAGSIVFSLNCPGAAECSVPGSITLKSAKDPSVIRTVPIKSGSVRVDEAEGTEWDVVLTSPGFWSLPQRITMPGENVERRETMKVWRTGTVRLTLKPAEPTPAAVRIQVAAPPDPRTTPDIPRGTSFDCVSATEGRWNCDVPAKPLDLAIRAEGFAPHYVWDAKIPVGGVLNAEVALRKGGALIAWLDSATVKQLEKPVRATVRYRSAPATSATGMRLATPVAEATFSSKGVVNITPLAAGRYILEASSEGYVPARFPIEIVDGRESTLRNTIELFPAITARFRVVPAVAPGDAPWNIELWRRTDHGTGWDRAGGGVASKEGILDAKDQAEGPIRVVVKDGRQNTLANREIVITSGQVEQVVTLEMVAVTGTVKLGDEPLVGAGLWFGGTSGAEKIHAESKEEGKFSVTLPRPGSWRVDIESPSTAISTTATITVEKDSDDVEILLPGTEVRGSVKDANGQPLPAAQVVILAGSTALRRLSDGEGNFRFRGVPSGPVSLHATDRRTNEDSRSVDIVVPEKGETPNIELVIEAARTMTGVVRSAGNTVIGAQVIAYAFVGGSAQQKRATTDLQGRFKLDIAGSAGEVILIVGAPGRSLHAFGIPVSSDPITLDIAPRGGELNLRWLESMAPLRMFFNDKMIPVPDLWEWSRAHGRSVIDSTIAVPDLAPGKYRFCSRDKCVEGLLAMGGRVDLDLTR